MTVRLLVVDDDPVFRAGLTVLAGDTGALEVVGEASAGGEALAAALAALDPAPDVVLMGLRLLDHSAIEIIRTLTGRASPAPKVLVLSATEDDDAVVAVLRAGARGYIVKGHMSRADLLRAIHIVAGGGAVFCPEVATRLDTYFSVMHAVPGRTSFPSLTDREREILDLLARGHNNRRIARELVLAEKTVRNHVSHVFAKLSVPDRTAAAVRARDAGMGI
jgi:DNA-binding NarL/FixJ family response regulator